MRIASVGHGVFAATMIAIGILGLIKSEYAAIWDGIPKALPGRELLPYLSALVALACGIGLLWPRTAALAARVLLAYLLLWMLIFKGRYIVLAPTQEGSYQSAGENAVIVAGAWVLYSWFADDWDKKRLAFAIGDKGRTHRAGVLWPGHARLRPLPFLLSGSHGTAHPHLAGVARVLGVFHRHGISPGGRGRAHRRSAHGWPPPSRQCRWHRSVTGVVPHLPGRQDERLQLGRDRRELRARRRRRWVVSESYGSEPWLGRIRAKAS